MIVPAKKGGDGQMASNKPPTNEQIIKRLDEISRQLKELFDAHKQLAGDVKQLAK